MLRGTFGKYRFSQSFSLVEGCAFLRFTARHRRISLWLRAQSRSDQLPPICRRSPAKWPPPRKPRPAAAPKSRPAKPHHQGSGENAADRILITLPVEPAAAGSHPWSPRLNFSLTGSRARTTFRRFPANSSPGFIRFDYQRSGQRTEIVIYSCRAGCPGSDTPSAARAERRAGRDRRRSRQ